MPRWWILIGAASCWTSCNGSEGDDTLDAARDADPQFDAFTPDTSNPDAVPAPRHGRDRRDDLRDGL